MLGEQLHFDQDALCQTNFTKLKPLCFRLGAKFDVQSYHITCFAVRASRRKQNRAKEDAPKTRPSFFSTTSERHKRPTDAEVLRGEKASICLLACLQSVCFALFCLFGQNQVSPSFFPTSHGSPGTTLPFSQSRGTFGALGCVHGLNDDEHHLRFQHRHPPPLEC
ncbi:Uncharacterized protein HZ326_2222 [Fusarium oxysporum f. sp. albedinis]|nr:Uncharacterized protein HZ326_2222 [Fusarium oxysporum f. sp. albedinis]